MMKPVRAVGKCRNPTARFWAQIPQTDLAGFTRLAKTRSCAHRYSSPAAETLDQS